MTDPADSTFKHLPGGEYLAQGIADLTSGRESIPSLLIAIAARRLGSAGLSLPVTLPPDPELRLFRMLRSLYGDDSYSQYNAHLRRLASLCHAMEMMNP